MKHGTMIAIDASHEIREMELAGWRREALHCWPVTYRNSQWYLADYPVEASPRYWYDVYRSGQSQRPPWFARHSWALEVRLYRPSNRR